jgi:hypothetical protein
MLKAKVANLDAHVRIKEKVAYHDGSPDGILAGVPQEHPCRASLAISARVYDMVT